jgi:hypothetical protein
MTKEIKSYIKAKQLKLNEAATIEQMELKFKDKDLDKILTQLLMEGIIFEPRPGVFRYLG